jgi:hypothetical protein
MRCLTTPSRWRGASLVACVLLACCPGNCLHPRHASAAAAEHRQSRWHACADVQALGLMSSRHRCCRRHRACTALISVLPAWQPLPPKPQLAGSAAVAGLSPSVVTTGRLAMPPSSGRILAHAPARAAKARPLLPLCLRRACGGRCPAPLRPGRPSAAMAELPQHAGLQQPSQLARADGALALVLPRWPTPGIDRSTHALEACKRCESTILHPCREKCKRCKQRPCRRCRQHSACQRPWSAR